LPNALPIPILNELVHGGFGYSQLLLVMYEPDSRWYDASLSITARGVKEGIRVEYHTYEQVPSKNAPAQSRSGESENLKKLGKRSST
jgi:hypothetical protein